MKRGPINLEKKLDIVFSKWVRFSNAPKGYCKCVTCGKIDAPEMMDAGHFCGRQHKCTRWDERNVWPQCRKCNRFQEGNKEAYAEFLVNEFGPTILTDLTGLENSICQFRSDWLEDAIRDYNTRLKEIMAKRK